jgi:isoleucyl-tRNA synthetase
LLAPVIPFVTEEMYQNLVISNNPGAPESIHLTSFPEIEPEFVNKELVKEVDYIIQLVSAGRALRNKSNIKVRQPLTEFVIRPIAGMDHKIIKKYERHILEELNVKKLTLIKDDAELVKYVIKLDFKKLGPKYGKTVPKIQQRLGEIPVEEVAKRVRQKLPVPVVLNGTSVTLEPDEIILETISDEKYVTMDSDGNLAGLNIHLTDELVLEGLARDLVRHIQELRKEADFEMSDRINLYYQNTEKIKSVIDQHGDYVKSEILAVELFPNLNADIPAKEIKIGMEKILVSVQKVS